MRFLLLAVTIFFSSLLTNPLDLVITRMNTQQPHPETQELKYRINFIKNIQTIAK